MCVCARACAATGSAKGFMQSTFIGHHSARQNYQVLRSVQFPIRGPPFQCENGLRQVPQVRSVPLFTHLVTPLPSRR